MHARQVVQRTFVIGPLNSIYLAVETISIFQHNRIRNGFFTLANQEVKNVISALESEKKNACMSKHTIYLHCILAPCKKPCTQQIDSLFTQGSPLLSVLTTLYV